MASDNIDVEPVIAKAKNLLIAIPEFAINAAITALVPPSVLIYRSPQFRKLI
jgi:hypothetical protein